MLQQRFPEPPAQGDADRETARLHWTASCSHAAQFYRNEAFLADSIARYLDAGLKQGQAALVFATPQRWDDVALRLRATGHDLDALALADRLIVGDARETLDAILCDGQPEAARFREVIGEAAAPGLEAAGRLCVYGELVDLLCAEGRHAAAVRLEELWNDLGRTQPMSLLCAYRLDNFANAADAAAFHEICERHGAVVPCESLGEPGGDARAREITRLQQRAQALETEIERRQALEDELRYALGQQDRIAAELRVARDEAERANHAKSDFLAVMSHELRTPLNAIVGYRDLLAMGVGGQLAPEQQKFLDRINHAAHQLLTLIDQVLSVSRIEAGHEEPLAEHVDLVLLARDAGALVEPIARGKGLTLELEAPESARCVSDGGKLRQILVNLLSNAVKYTVAGGIRVVVAEAEDAVVVEVHDTGVGIADTDLPRIFDRFVQLENSLTRRHEGTGLGLSVCRDYAHLLGADLRVRSHAGNGSVFTLRVPRRHRAAQSDHACDRIA